MVSTRIVIGIVVTAASALVGLAACSGSTTNTSTGDGGASPSGTSGSNTSGGTPGSGTSGGSAFKQCPSTATTNCTEAENATYSSCIQDKCDATLAKCYGADYKSGTFGGECGSYITCTQACACGDSACLTKCTSTDACTSCLIPAVANCVGMCTAPACATGGSSGTSGGGSKTCADLKACCDKIPAGSKKDSCDAVYDSVKTTESNCSIVYPQYAADCP